MKKYNIKIDGRGLMDEEIIELIMENRGIDDVEHFLNPTEDDLLPLDALKNIDKAYEIIERHINKKSKIAILADTDTDGITSGAIIARYLKNFTEEDNIDVFINEGKAHGLDKKTNNRFMDYKLLIVVDSLDKNISNYMAIKNDFNCDIVVLDHHAIDSKVPYDDYVCLVSSQRDYDNQQLSGAGVCWKFCKYYDEQNLTEYADELVDLAATGIVADMMDITVPENRYIVSKGLEEIHNLALKKIIGSYEFNSTAIAFSVAPMINACNRMNKNGFAMRAFLSDDNKEVLANMKILKQCKEDQNTEVDSMMNDIISQCESQKDEKIIIVYVNTEHGIAGLIGNKLLERYQRPLLVLNDCGNSYAGSMRAVGVTDFRKMCNDSGLAIANGHELASGIEIKKKNIDKFREYINAELKELIISDETDVDVQLNLEDVTRGLIYKIKKLDRISGVGFKPIKFYIDGITEYEVSNFSQYKHLVIKPSNELMFIKWNWNGSFDDMEDNALMNEELKCICTLDSGFIGKIFTLKGICDEINTVA